ncbi:uncharacterized protein K452DRAFT_282254 [Aplosporella prunicola CBS 121167]|uniref:Uncharacterized protein n=1 Tax=Aplosporella prunicola CBS 121167 TaxID=1176127 RepID=A0A6A6BWP3_9PEZI|nr:uncharacterized protein K452DRAFT_282254 [Aplosporella prunicola CBS 121167]KAF2147264.1 hypothetical protein K452DRAFT_282254 [Aplosporella prunicola CBS 121167]
MHAHAVLPPGTPQQSHQTSKRAQSTNTHQHTHTRSLYPSNLSICLARSVVHIIIAAHGPPLAPRPAKSPTRPSV